MDLVNRMNLEFLSKSQNESFARVAVSAFITQADPTLEVITDIKTAVSEAVTNSIIHGYDGCEGTIRINAELYQDRVIIEVIDNGNGIEDIEKAMQPLYTSRPELERSGMGFTVMQTFMDEVNVTSAFQQGTCVVMIKYFDEEKGRGK